MRWSRPLRRERPAADPAPQDEIVSPAHRHIPPSSDRFPRANPIETEAWVRGCGPDGAHQEQSTRGEQEDGERDLTDDESVGHPDSARSARIRADESPEVCHEPATRQRPCRNSPMTLSKRRGDLSKREKERRGRMTGMPSTSAARSRSIRTISAQEMCFVRARCHRATAWRT